MVSHPEILSAQAFMQKTNCAPVIDVRSPSEYQNGHIPGAYNIPLFDDEERARVGTMYKKSGRKAAIYLGLELVGPKMKKLVTEAFLKAKDNELLLHCWRGGMRSENMGWLLSMSGIKCSILEGGYKNYRKYIRNQFLKKANIIILSGMTGSGKTDILKEMATRGMQVLDLEALSHHKGSAFGALGQLSQPSNEQFENDIYERWKQFDLTKPVWIEDESHSIGSNFIPDPLFEQMRNTHVVKIEVGKKHRIERLVREYSDFDDELIRQSIMKIYRRLGGQHAEEAVKCLEKKDYHSIADITLTYYDKAYHFGIQKRNPIYIHPIELKPGKPGMQAEIIINFAEKIFGNGSA